MTSPGGSETWPGGPEVELHHAQRRSGARTRAGARSGARSCGENRNSSRSMNAIQRESSRCSSRQCVEGARHGGGNRTGQSCSTTVPSLEVGREHLAVVVRAVVVVEEEALYAHQAMELDPFLQVRAPGRGRSCRRRGTGAALTRTYTRQPDEPDRDTTADRRRAGDRRRPPLAVENPYTEETHRDRRAALRRPGRRGDRRGPRGGARVGRHAGARARRDAARGRDPHARPHRRAGARR